MLWPVFIWPNKWVEPFIRPNKNRPSVASGVFKIVGEKYLLTNARISAILPDKVECVKSHDGISITHNVIRTIHGNTMNRSLLL